MDVAQEKNELRKRLRAERKALDPDYRMRVDAEIARKTCEQPVYREADAVFAYFSIGSEVDTQMIIRDALEQGKLVAIPRVVPGTRTMEWYRIDDFEGLEKSSFGVLEPVANPARLVMPPRVDEDLAADTDAGAAADTDADAAAAETSASARGMRAIALVPGLAFDAQGFRLGYGAGFYDVFLSTFAGASIGLCRKRFLSPGPLPCDDFDLPVDMVITD